MKVPKVGLVQAYHVPFLLLGSVLLDGSLMSPREGLARKGLVMGIAFLFLLR